MDINESIRAARVPTAHKQILLALAKEHGATTPKQLTRAGITRLHEYDEHIAQALRPRDKETLIQCQKLLRTSLAAIPRL